MLRWAALAIRLRWRTLQGQAFWDTESQGVLAVTTERILFDGRPEGGLAQWPLTKLLSVEKDRLGGEPIVSVWMDGRQKPIGFLAAETKATATFVDHDTGASVPVEVTLTTQDLVELLKH